MMIVFALELFWRNQQIRVRPAIGPAYAASQLVELRQTVPVRPIDDDRVRVGDIQPVLHNRGCHQHVVFVRDEVDHHLFELAITHLAVADANLDLRHQALNQAGDRPDRLHTIVNEIDLPAAFELGAHGSCNHILVELHDMRLN